MPSLAHKFQTTQHEDRLVGQLDEPFRSLLLTVLLRIAHRLEAEAEAFVRVARTYESPMAAEARYRVGRYLDTATGTWVDARRPDDPIATRTRPGHHPSHYRRSALLRIEHSTRAGIALVSIRDEMWVRAIQEVDRKEAFLHWTLRKDGLHVYDRHWRTLARLRDYKGLGPTERAEGLLDERDHHR